MSKKTQNEKNPEVDGSDNQAIVVNTNASSNRHLKKLSGRAILIICAIVLVGALAYAYHHQKEKEARIDYTKVTALVNADDCSAKAQQSVSKEQPTPKRIDPSISLLAYREMCLAQSGKFQDANKVLLQMKSYLALKHDKAGEAVIEQQIEANSIAIKAYRPNPSTVHKQ